MKYHQYAVFTIALIGSIAAWAQKTPPLVIPPLEKSTPKLLVKAKAEKVSLTGPLKTIPMGGAKTTIQSANFGQVVLFAPMELDAATQKMLEKWENDGVHVKVTGVMATVCSERELKAEVIGCRWIDTSKSVTVEKH